LEGVLGIGKSKEKNIAFKNFEGDVFRRRFGLPRTVGVLEQFVKLMDQIDLNEIGIKEKIKAEVERVKKFQRIILGTKEKIEVKDIDIRNYAKYVLKESSDPEKRELLSCLKSKIILNNKNILLQTNEL
jgi:hypothetical protein